MIVAGTGHRPNKLGGFNNESFLKLVKIAEDWIRTNNPEKIISGMAQGWDQALAQAAVNCGIPFIAALPFKGQEIRWSQKSQRYYNRLLSKAEDIIYVCDEGYEPYKMQVRNEWMVDNTNLVLAMWDGTTGGTLNCLKYAYANQKDVINLYDKLKISC
jgi:uncharacterized phage-like protein YoqJ